MLANYFTLRAIVREWQSTLAGREIVTAYSQSKGELTIVVGSGEDQVWSLRIATRAPLRFLYAHQGQNRAKRNTRTIFENVAGESVVRFSIADADRQIRLELSNGRAIRIDLFGSRSNVYLLDGDGVVLDRFRDVGTAPGGRPPEPRQDQIPHSAEELRTKMAAISGTVVQRLQKSISIFDRTLAEEAVFRARARDDGDIDQNDIFQAVCTIRDAFESTAARVYSEDGTVRVLSAIRLESRTEFEEETFPTMNQATAFFVRRKLADSGLENIRNPLRSAVTSRLERSSRRLSRMKEELANPSRADQYEAFGHLLMASQSLVEPGLDSVTLEDVISGSGMATVKLDPLLGVVQNAERYYDKARKVRQSRITSDARIEKATSEVDRLVDLQNAIQELKTRDDVVRFKKDRADDLSWLSGSKDGGELQVPFRQFDIGDGYLVWVGRNATQNDELTLHAARKYDYWLHARGVAGSHVVLRVPIRNVRPPRSVIEKAAAIAAYFSKARTSSYAPVIFTEKKFVRKPRKSPAGSVLVEREEVIMVEPGIPSD